MGSLNKLPGDLHEHGGVDLAGSGSRHLWVRWKQGVWCLVLAVVWETVVTRPGGGRGKRKRWWEGLEEDECAKEF